MIILLNFSCKRTHRILIQQVQKNIIIYKKERDNTIIVLFYKVDILFKTTIHNNNNKLIMATEEIELLEVYNFF